MLGPLCWTDKTRPSLLGGYSSDHSVAVMGAIAWGMGPGEGLKFIYPFLVPL